MVGSAADQFTARPLIPVAASAARIPVIPMYAPRSARTTPGDGPDLGAGQGVVGRLVEEGDVVRPSRAVEAPDD